MLDYVAIRHCCMMVHIPSVPGSKKTLSMLNNFPEVWSVSCMFQNKFNIHNRRVKYTLNKF